MGANEKELRVNITGNSDKFGEAAKKAEQYINQLKTQGLDALTAGVYTGGATALAEKTIDAIKSVITEIKTILDRADRLNVSTSAAIQLKRFGEVLGIDVGQIDAGVQNARVARSDALAGDDNVQKAFEGIGLSLKEIKDLKPDELFRRILDTAKEQELTAQRFFYYSKLIGQEPANTALPYARNPEALGIARGVIQGRVSAGKTLDVLGLGGLLDFASSAGAEPLKLARVGMRSLRQPFEPFSAFGPAQQEQSEFMAEQNRQKILLVGRSQLNTEQRINEVIAERLRLSRLISEEQDPIKRQKFISDGIAVEAELAGLTAKRATELRAPAGKFGTDPLRSIGADFSRFSPTLATNLQAQTNNEIRTLRRSLEAGLQKLDATLSYEGP